MFKDRKLNLLILVFFAWFCCPTGQSGAVVNSDTEPPAKAPGRYEIRENRPRKESIFDITFGPPPPMATERGILIIDAYNDLNNNQKQDENELPLIEEISCRLGTVDYLVPAFIPGLGYNESYTVRCSGTAYQPSEDQPEVFIEKRGQIIRLNVPCRTQVPTPPVPGN